MNSDDLSRPELPREDLIRMTELGDAQMRMADDGNTLVGYAAMFNQPTIIDSWEGRFTEVIAPGAFAKTIAERGSQIKVLFNHGFDPSIGDKPLGKPSVIREDSQGLWVEVPLDDTSYNKDLKASLRSGALDGQSFRFSVIKDEYTPGNGMQIRTLKEVRLFELGPVTFPAYEATTAGVRARPAYEAYRTVHISGDLSPDQDKWAAAAAGLRTSQVSEPPSGTPTDKPTPSHLTLPQRQQVARQMRRLLDFKEIQ